MEYWHAAISDTRHISSFSPLPKIRQPFNSFTCPPNLIGHQDTSAATRLVSRRHTVLLLLPNLSVGRHTRRLTQGRTGLRDILHQPKKFPRHFLNKYQQNANQFTYYLHDSTNYPWVPVTKQKSTQWRPDTVLANKSQKLLRHGWPGNSTLCSFRHCNAVYNQNTKERWTKRCTFSFPKIGDLGFAKNYLSITLTSIAAKIYNALPRNLIENTIEKILRKN